jgi:hypothetical protein
VIGLADAIAKGDSSKLGGMLTPEAKADLDVLTSGEEWDLGTAKIEAVRVVSLNDLTPGGPGGGPGGSGASTGATIQLAIQDPDGAYLLGWEAVKVDDRWAFKGVEAPADEKRRAVDFDAAAGGDTPAAASGSSPAAAPSAAAALGKDGEIAFFVFWESQRRMVEAGGTAVNDAVVTAMVSQFGASAGNPGDIAAAGKNALRSGGTLQDPFIPMIFMALKTNAGSVTDDQVLQFISNVSGMPLKIIREKALGGLPGGIPAGVPGSGGGRRPGAG